jgi:hypothetical protein
MELSRPLEGVGLRRPVAGGSGPCLKADSYILLLGQQFDCLSSRRVSTGAVLSPLLWSFVDRLLAVINDQGFSAFGYADDSHHSPWQICTQVRELMQAALNKVVKWTTKEGLSISPQKTAVFPFTYRRNIEGLGQTLTHIFEFGVTLLRAHNR